jgi:hypothetical protein
MFAPEVAAILTRDEILELLRDTIVASMPNATRTMLAEEASLLDELALDSLRLASVFASIRQETGEFDLMPWLAQAAGGKDTLGGLADFIFVARAGAQRGEEDAR